MGISQRECQRLLSLAGTISHGTLRFPTPNDVASSSFKDEAQYIYRTLDGVLPSFALNLRGWDIEFDGIAVELDEELHFNRYRAATMVSGAYESLPGFPLRAYGQYCSDHEKKCLSAGGYGGKWSSPSTIAQFGLASPPGELTGSGSPRWKQRAFYDFIKDLSPLLIGVIVVRISVWDTVIEAGRNRAVWEVLRRPSEASSSVLATLVMERAGDTAK